MQKFREIMKKIDSLNKEAIEVITEFVNQHGGCIRTDDNECDTIYGYILNDYTERIEEVYILAVFVQDNELYIHISYGENFLEDEYVPNINNGHVYSFEGDCILFNATLCNICEFIEEYVEE